MTCCLRELFINGEMSTSKERYHLVHSKLLFFFNMLKSSSSHDCLSDSDVPE